MTQDTPAALSVEMHAALCPAHTGGNCTCEKFDPAVDKAWAQFCAGIGDGPNAPYPGMIAAFERYYSQSFADKAWRSEAATWAAAWKASQAATSAAGGAPTLLQAATDAYVYLSTKVSGVADKDYRVVMNLATAIHDAALAAQSPDSGAGPEKARLLAESVLALNVVTEPGLRAKEAARAVLDATVESPAELSLRSLACWLGVGGYNSLTIDAKVMERRIREGVEADRAALAQQGAHNG